MSRNKRKAGSLKDITVEPLDNGYLVSVETYDYSSEDEAGDSKLAYAHTTVDHACGDINGVIEAVREALRDDAKTDEIEIVEEGEAT